MENGKDLKRNVLGTQPVSVEYEITEYGSTLKNLTRIIVEWGIEHRRRIIGK